MLSAHRHIPTSTTTTASIVAGGHFHQLQPDAELLAHPNVQLPVWVNSDLASNQGFQGPPIGKTSYLTTTELLLRAQALLAKDVHPAELRRPRRRSRQHSPTLSYRSDSSQSSHFSCDREQLDRREERQKRHRQRYRTTNDDVVRFKVGSATPEKETVAANVDGVDLDDDDDDDDDEQLVERLREMDVSDLVEQRDVLTRQIATSLVTPPGRNATSADLIFGALFFTKSVTTVIILPMAVKISDFAVFFPRCGEISGRDFQRILFSRFCVKKSELKPKHFPRNLRRNFTRMARKCCQVQLIYARLLALIILF